MSSKLSNELQMLIDKATEQVAELMDSVEHPIIHVTPVNDYRPHNCDINCWCKPVLCEETNVCTHNSLDRREHSYYQ